VTLLILHGEQNNWLRMWRSAWSPHLLRATDHKQNVRSESDSEIHVRL